MKIWNFCFLSFLLPVFLISCEESLIENHSAVTLASEVGKNQPALKPVNPHTAELLKAVSKENIKALAELIEQGADVNAVDKDGYTLLIQASIYGYTKSAQFLIAKGADVFARDKDGNTALLWACFKGHIKIAEGLIDGGADIEAKNRWKSTALMRASENNKAKTVELLIRKGADVKAQDINGETALDRAEKAGHKEVVALLKKLELRNKSDIRVRF